ncbi:MAG: AIDA repeat-containing protein [Desulfovibrionaceae bacterium]|nr:AIDA repeat-containing protein [Desulfovibrionaceae bacterium]
MNYYNDPHLTLTDAAIYDAEKSPTTNQDNAMCWAATAANMLAWTGWGAYGLGVKKNVSLEDRIFAYFQDNFLFGAVRGGNSHNGIEWFFDGTYTPEGDVFYDQPEENSGNAIGFYADPFLQTQMLDMEDVDGLVLMNTVSEALDRGAAVGLGIYGEYMQHAITCWGYTCDDSLATTDHAYYTGLFISDSDDDAEESEPSDTIRYVPITWSNSTSSYIFDLGSKAFFGDESIDYVCTLERKYGDIIEKKKTKNVSGRYSDATVFGKMTVYSGGRTSNTRIASGGKQSVAGQDSAATLFSGGSQIVTSGGVARGATVKTGGKQYISLGGVAVDTNVKSGGLQIVRSGRASGAMLYGSQNVSKGGVATSAAIFSGGRQYVHSGGKAVGTVVSKGGNQSILTGGLASATTLYGGQTLISSGGRACDVTVRGGKLIAKDGARISSVSVKSGGKLSIAQGNVLAGISYVTSGTIDGGTKAAPVVLAKKARLTVDKASLRSLHLNIASASLIAAGAGTTLGSLKGNAASIVKYDISTLKARGKVLLSIGQESSFDGKCSINTAKSQGMGTYKLSSKLDLADKKAVAITVDNVQQGSAKLNGSAVSVNGVTYTLKEKNSQITMTLALKKGELFSSTAAKNTFKGTSDSDIFFGGGANNTITGVNGRDVVVYDSATAWGKDVIQKTGGTLTLLFNGQSADDVVTRKRGSTMTITDKDDSSQKITVKGWNDDTHNIVFSDSLKSIAAFLATDSPSVSQQKKVCSEVWQKAGLAQG